MYMNLALNLPRNVANCAALENLQNSIIIHFNVLLHTETHSCGLCLL